MRKNSLKHILTTEQFLHTNVCDQLFTAAEAFKKDPHRKCHVLENKILATVFYEPSTRTRFSFESAMMHLGGQVITTESAGQFSSAIKGETLEDSIRVIGGYCDGIVLRHPEVGSAQKAARVSTVPIINAGDGAGEHPTQALIDLFTIQNELKRPGSFTITFVGDLLYGRTIHSLVQLLATCKKVKVSLVSPPELRLPEKYREFLTAHEIDFSETTQLDEVLLKTDILYMTRIQKERFASQELFETVKDAFILDSAKLSRLPKHAAILHPLPRVNEIPEIIDRDQRAAYFRQAANGLFVRMALLEYVMNQK